MENQKPALARSTAQAGAASPTSKSMMGVQRALPQLLQGRRAPRDISQYADQRVHSSNAPLGKTYGEPAPQEAKGGPETDGRRHSVVQERGTELAASEQIVLGQVYKLPTSRAARAAEVLKWLRILVEGEPWSAEKKGRVQDRLDVAARKFALLHHDLYEAREQMPPSGNWLYAFAHGMREKQRESELLDPREYPEHARLFKLHCEHYQAYRARKYPSHSAVISTTANGSSRLWSEEPFDVDFAPRTEGGKRPLSPAAGAGSSSLVVQAVEHEGPGKRQKSFNQDSDTTRLLLEAVQRNTAALMATNETSQRVLHALNALVHVQSEQAAADKEHRTLQLSLQDEARHREEKANQVRMEMWQREVQIGRAEAQNAMNQAVYGARQQVYGMPVFAPIRAPTRHHS